MTRWNRSTLVNNPDGSTPMDLSIVDRTVARNQSVASPPLQQSTPHWRRWATRHAGEHLRTATPFPIHATTILDSIADGVFTVDATMHITYFNKAAERITGVPRQDAIGQYCFEVLRANICEKTCALKSTFTTGREIINTPVNILRADARQIPISISTAVLRDNNGKIVGGVESFRDLSPMEELRKEITRRYTFEDILSKNHLILALFDILPHIAESESSVLIQGPSGSGKELFARAIHNLSRRRAGPFVGINCGALPDTLLESELFGYVQGAFTDARKDKPGRFESARGGTIFLDEIDSMPLSVQVKLLRVLQEREFQPLGATTAVKSDVRVVAATKEDLAGRVATTSHFVTISSSG